MLNCTVYRQIAHCYARDITAIATECYESSWIVTSGALQEPTRDSILRGSEGKSWAKVWSNALCGACMVWMHPFRHPLGTVVLGTAVRESATAAMNTVDDSCWACPGYGVPGTFGMGQSSTCTVYPPPPHDTEGGSWIHVSSFLDQVYVSHGLTQGPAARLETAWPRPKSGGAPASAMLVAVGPPGECPT